MNCREILFTNTKHISSYLKDIQSYRILTPDEEVNLFIKYNNGDINAKEQIIKSNQRFVVSVAKRYSNNDNLPDLISEGNIGLINAIDKFDITRGFKFISYAVFHIKKSILSYLLTMNNTIRNPRSSAIHFSNIIRDNYFNEYGEEISDEELVERVQVKYPKINLNHLQKNDFEEVDSETSDNILYSKNINYDNLIETKIEKNHDVTITNKLLSLLTPIERNIIEKLYGLNGHESQHIERIAEEYNMTKEGIRRIKLRGLSQMRNVEYKNII